MSMLEMYRFKTARFVVRAYIEADMDVDTSYDETGETQKKLDSGEYEAFGTVVEVMTATGIKLGESSLWGSIYERPSDFFCEHRKGAGAYFPQMVREAIGEARKAIAAMPKVKGLHGPVYVERALYDEARRDIERLPIRAALGDKITALEQIGYLLVKGV